MPAFAKIFDPTFEDLEDPYRHYNAAGEPLDYRLYLPVGVDPGKKRTEVVALHPHPSHEQILLQGTIPTTGLPQAFQRVAETYHLAAPFGAVPVLVFEATSISWRPLRDLFVRLGVPTATVSAVQVKHLRGTQTRKKKSDAIDALQVAKLFKNGASHASRIPPEPLASLRELCRAHLFFAEFLVAAQNRIVVQRFVLHPESCTPFRRIKQRTPMTLVTQGLVAPSRLLALSLDELTQLLPQTSHGRHGVEQALLCHGWSGMPPAAGRAGPGCRFAPDGARHAVGSTRMNLLAGLVPSCTPTGPCAIALTGLGAGRSGPVSRLDHPGDGVVEHRAALVRRLFVHPDGQARGGSARSLTKVKPESCAKVVRF